MIHGPMFEWKGDDPAIALLGVHRTDEYLALELELNGSIQVFCGQGEVWMFYPQLIPCMPALEKMLNQAAAALEYEWYRNDG